VADTGPDGRVLLPVTRAMVDEQGLDFSEHGQRLRYAAVPITFDHANFSSGTVASDYVLDARSILDHYVEHVDRVRPLDEIERLSDSEWASLVNNGDATFARFPLNSPEIWHPPAVVREWFQLRTREEARQTESMRHPYDAAIPTYPWEWPALPLLWRSSALIAGPVAIETDSGRWAELVRAQFIGTFDRMCHEREQALAPRDAWQALQGLWWLEAQALSLPVADQHAQQRAVAWDHGIRCKYAEAKEIQRGPSPQTFSTREFCVAWTAERHSFIDAAPTRRPPPTLDILKPDFSRREGKCSNVLNGGAFQQ